MYSRKLLVAAGFEIFDFFQVGGGGVRLGPAYTLGHSSFFKKYKRKNLEFFSWSKETDFGNLYLSLIESVCADLGVVQNRRLLDRLPVLYTIRDARGLSPRSAAAIGTTRSSSDSCSQHVNRIWLLRLRLFLSFLGDMVSENRVKSVIKYSIVYVFKDTALKLNVKFRKYWRCALSEAPTTGHFRN